MSLFENLKQLNDSWNTDNPKRDTPWITFLLWFISIPCILIQQNSRSSQNHNSIWTLGLTCNPKQIKTNRHLVNHSRIAIAMLFSMDQEVTEQTQWAPLPFHQAQMQCSRIQEMTRLIERHGNKSINNTTRFTHDKPWRTSSGLHYSSCRHVEKTG